MRMSGHAFAQETTVDPVLLTLREISERLAALPNGLRQTLQDHLWADIPVTITEAAYNANLATGTPMYATPQTSALELITAVIATVPAGATGLIQLGSIFIPAGAGPTLLAPVEILLSSTDARSLTISTTAGPAALVLCGRQRPTFGVMAK